MNKQVRIVKNTCAANVASNNFRSDESTVVSNYGSASNGVVTKAEASLNLSNDISSLSNLPLAFNNLTTATTNHDNSTSNNSNSQLPVALAANFMTLAATDDAVVKPNFSGTVWLDANGKVTDDITKSVTGEIYSHTKGDWQRLSKAKLAEAVKAVIENTPGAKASLEQDYKIAKWKYDQNGSNPDITDKNGILLTPEQYLAKRIDPFYNAATFYNQK